MRQLFWKRERGSSLMLAFALIAVLMLELAITGSILTRSLGYEGLLLSQNTTARKGLDAAFSRLEQNLYTYVATYGVSSTIDTAFASSGTSPTRVLTNYVLQTTDPSSASTYNTVTVSAWVNSRRGNYYQLHAESKLGDITLKANRWILINPCSPSGSLVTIAPSLAYAAVVNSQTGRLYFGDNSGRFVTWSPTTGMTTILSNNGAFVNSGVSAIYESQERVFMGGTPNPANFFTWSAATGLTTIGNFHAPGYYSTKVDQLTGRVFFGEHDAAAANVGGFYTWLNGSLTTLVSGRSWPGAISTQVDPLTGRVFFGEADAVGNFYTWLSSTGLSTLLSNRSHPGYQSSAIDPLTGRVFFGENQNPTNFYSWLSSTGLSTLSSSTAGHANGGVVAQGHYGPPVSPVTGRVFFGENIGALDSSRFFTWLSSTGLSTLISGTDNPGNMGNVVSTYGGVDRVFFNPTVGSSSNFNVLTWSAATGVSTILSGRPGLGKGSMMADSSTGRIFFGEFDPAGTPANVGNYYTWSTSTGLSTLMSGIASLGNGVLPESLYRMVDASGSGRIYFNQGINPGTLFTWAQGTGLSTLLNAVNLPGYYGSDPTTGRMYIGGNSSGYIYTPPEACNNQGY